jgi:hypothetical protein
MDSGLMRANPWLPSFLRAVNSPPMGEAVRHPIGRVADKEHHRGALQAMVIGSVE